MNPPLRRILFSLAVLFWSAVLLYFYSTGRITRYLAPDFRPITFVGGLGLAVLGLFNLLTARQSADCGHDHDADTACHDHETSDVHPVIALLLMVIPVALSVAWTKDEYSADTLTRKGLYESPAAASSLSITSNLPPLTRETLEKYHAKSDDGYFDFSLMDLFYATGDREVQSLLEGMKIETLGRWVEEKAHNPNGTRKRLYRLFITCCVADSRAIPIILEFGKTPPNFPENDWVKASGTMRFPMEDGMLQAVLEVDQVIASNPPDEESFMRK